MTAFWVDYSYNAGRSRPVPVKHCQACHDLQVEVREAMGDAHEATVDGRVVFRRTIAANGPGTKCHPV